MILIILHWAGFAAQLLTIEELLRRRIAKRLPFFFAFLCAAAGEFLVLGCNFTTGKYAGIQEGLAPWMAVLQVGAGVEAFAWFVSRLPKFKIAGAVVFVVVSSVALVTEYLTAPPRSDYAVAVQAMEVLERCISFSLGTMLIMSLVLFSAIGMDAAPKWHAACIACLSMGDASGWQSMSFAMIMWSMIAALALWNWKVWHGPSWITPAPIPYDAEAVAADWRKFDESVRRAREFYDN